VPQGAASLSLAVLENDGRKREGSSDEQCGLAGSRKARGKTRDGDNVRAIPRLTVGKATVAYARQSALGLLPLGGDSRNRGERRASWRSYETAASLGPQENGREKKVGLPTRRDGITRKTRRCSSTVPIGAVSAANQLRAAYWLPAAGLPAFRIEVAAAKMRAAL
jgi:hypothetical protein